MDRWRAALTASRMIDGKSRSASIWSPAAVVPAGLVISVRRARGDSPVSRTSAAAADKAPAAHLVAVSGSRPPAIPPWVRDSSISRAKAGPLPLTAVTVSRSFSLTSRAVPTEEKIRRASSRSSGVAEGAGAMAVSPFLSRTAVLGIVLIIRRLPPAATSRSDARIPATMDMSSLP